MRRGTTPTITLTVDADIADWTVYVSFNNGNTVTTLEDDRLTKTVNSGQTFIDITLTQEETLAFTVGKVEVQIRAIKDDVAIATNIMGMDVDRIILDGEIDEQ